MNQYKINQVALPELLEFIVDNRGKTVPTSDAGIPLIATNCIKNSELFPVYEKLRYLSLDTYKTWFRAHPIPGDIIFVNKGTPGRVCMVPEKVGFCIAQDMMAFRADKKKICPKYLFAALRSPKVQSFISQYHVGTLIPHLKKSDLDKILIPVFSINKQRSIGDFYYSFSLKIEINNKIIDNLEEQAQALYKSWFIDFDPFQDGEFEESELGMIPKGWKVGELSSICHIVSGYAFKSKSFGEHGIPIVKIKSIGGLCLPNDRLSYLKHGEHKFEQLENYKLLPGDIVLAMTGATIGKMSRIAHTGLYMNQRVCCYRPYHMYKEFVDRMILHKNYYKYILANIDSDTAQANISVKTLLKYTTIIPPENILKQFSDLVRNLHILLMNLSKQNQTLAELRDTLLPKLMSGEIELPVETEE